jgi:hypothetical protein
MDSAATQVRGLRGQAAIHRLVDGDGVDPLRACCGATDHPRLRPLK